MNSRMPAILFLNIFLSLTLCMTGLAQDTKKSNLNNFRKKAIEIARNEAKNLKDNSSKLQESKSHSSNDILKPQEIRISQNTAENGEVLFELDDPKLLKFSVSNTPYTVTVINGKGCILCTSTIKLSPHVKVPTAVFADSEFTNNLKGASSVAINNSFSGTIEIGAKKREYIIAGKNGAILKKEGDGFKLIQGNAYLKILDKFTE